MISLKIIIFSIIVKRDMCGNIKRYRKTIQTGCDCGADIMSK